ncbi:MAG: hypothetical protein QF701_03220 [Nitrospinota bacterium]|nr:hypothetical protein [Nitrospinota bacterium]
MRYPFFVASPWAASGLLPLLSFAYMILSGLALGGMVFMLAAQLRGARSVDPRWSQLARLISSWVMNVLVFGVALSGSMLWLVFVFVHPAAAAELQKIFRIPDLFGWGFLLIGCAAFFFCSSGWERWRDNFSRHLAAGVVAALAIWAAAAIPISLGSFSMTPGFWLNTGSPWDAFWNRSFAAAFLVWSALSVALAGCAGLLYAAWRRDELWRASLSAWLGKWTAAASFAGAVFSVGWVFTLFFEGIPVVSMGAGVVALSAVLGVFLILLAVRRPKYFGKVLSIAAAALLFAQVGGIHKIRSEPPGPFLIQGHMFRNGILISDIGKISASGLWKQAPWRPDADPPGQLELGAFSFRAQCISCHSGWAGDGGIPALTAIRYQGDALRFLDEMPARHPSLPVFAGSLLEKEALASYVESRIRASGGSLASRPPAPPPPVIPEKREPPEASAPLPAAEKPPAPSPAGIEPEADTATTSGSATPPSADTEDKEPEKDKPVAGDATPVPESVEASGEPREPGAPQEGESAGEPAPEKEAGDEAKPPTSPEGISPGGVVPEKPASSPETGAPQESGPDKKEATEQKGPASGDAKPAPQNGKTPESEAVPATGTVPGASPEVGRQSNSPPKVEEPDVPASPGQAGTAPKVAEEKPGSGKEKR